MARLPFISRFPAGRWIPLVSGLALTALFAWLQASPWPVARQLFQRAEAVAYDVRLNAALQAPARDERLVIVTIDEKSLQAEGRWPWPRQRLGALVEGLFARGAVVVGFDMMFSERELGPARALVEDLRRRKQGDMSLHRRLAALAAENDPDAAFARSFAAGDVVLGYTFHNDPVSSAGRLPPPLMRLPGELRELAVFTMPRYTANIESLQQAGAREGFVTTAPDADGILRRSPLLIRHGDALYGSLALEMARLYLLLDDIRLEHARVGEHRVLEGVRLGKLLIPTDAAGRVIVPYGGASPRFRYISASDVLNGAVEEGALEGKMVLVGATALGLSDLVATPVQNIYPGVEVHATLITAILDERFPCEPLWMHGANLTVLILAGGALALALPWLGAAWLLTVFALTTGALVYANLWLWREHGLVLNLASPVLLAMLLAGLNLAYGFMREARQRGQLKEMFGQYVPPVLVERMMREPGRWSTAGESRDMTVLFADVRDFTSLSEELTPNALKQLLNQFFTAMTRIIFDRHGTVDKFVGDMIMAFWGAPLADENHAQHATESALDMVAALQTLNPRLAAQGLPPVRIGIGVNTGVMNVGDMGSEYRRAYTVIGDAVNLGSRIEGLTKYYGAEVVIGESTQRRLQGIVCRKLDRVRVKGKHAAVEVYQPLCRRADASAESMEELQRYERALHHYWRQEWDEAHALCAALHARHPGVRIYALYLERIADMRQRQLPPDWDGVYERRSK